MKIVKGKAILQSLIKLVLGGFLTTVLFYNPAVFAMPDYIFFSVNGDTTLSSMTQGDEFYWASNCDTGATINWEIWYDANSNSTIDPSVDLLLASENITDGNAVTEPDPIKDGYTIGEAFRLSGEPGVYIFKATDITSDVSLQRIMTMVAMSSPPNQFTGQIFLPGISAPNSLLENRLIFAETESGDEGVSLGVTDNMGMYSMNISALGTGVEFYLGASNINGYVAPGEIFATASGVVGGNDFTYTAATDSVWGLVKDETGTALNFRTDVAAESGSQWRSSTTSGGRYAIYFSGTDNGIWTIEIDSRISPDFLSPKRLEFDLDTVTSFEHDIVLTRTDAMIYARITENGGLPVNNYRVDAFSASLESWTESVSGTGSDNIVTLHVSSLDPDGWQVMINQWDDDFSIPAGLVVESDAFNVAPGDTVTLNLVTGILISGTLTQDPEDDPIVWDDVWVGVQPYGTSANEGAYSFYAVAGTYYLGASADGYLANPGVRYLELNADTSSGLDFTINEAHCRVHGTLTNVPLPLPSPDYFVTARTGIDNFDGYYVNAQIDSVTGMYQMDLCDGNWTIIPPWGFPDADPPESTVVAIGESPDTARTIDFEYISNSVLCGDANGDGAVNIGDPVYIINYIFKFGPTPDPLCIADVNSDDAVNIGDPVYLINFIFKEGNPPIEPCCP
ncbi:MAG: hypothetical protein GY841_07915 [FCB group bacterium]|nr:hypothetical protein [FCB group bacterium]